MLSLSVGWAANVSKRGQIQDLTTQIPQGAVFPSVVRKSPRRWEMMESRLAPGSTFYICQVCWSPAGGGAENWPLSLLSAELLPVPDCQQPRPADLLLLRPGDDTGGQHAGGRGQSDGPDWPRHHQPPHRSDPHLESGTDGPVSSRPPVICCKD